LVWALKKVQKGWRPVRIEKRGQPRKQSG